MSRSLLSELGLDAEHLEWHDLALCRNSEIDGPENDFFFDRYESSPESAKAADQMCLHCPVMRQCFFEGSRGNQGLWGGVYWMDSGKPDVNRNRHKTDEIWDEIYSRVGR